MADVRSLLRQQRAARRIEHPHAAYSDGGKLLCTVCHEQIKTESLWEGHIQAEGHRKRLQRLQTVPRVNGQSEDGGKQKRKHDDAGADEDVDMDDMARRKRSRPEVDTPTLVESEGDKELKEQTSTPPRLSRRTSQTPSQGIELQIPSRPATPAHRDGSSVSTPGNQQLTSHSTTSLPSRRASALVNEDRPTSITPQVDEAEWAAFEADIAATSVPYDEDAVISAPAMTAEESAAAIKAEEEAAEKRRAQADVDLEDEKEEATRALEEEFDEMEELEARVKRLKEKREALRKRGGSFGQEAASKPEVVGKEKLKDAIMEEDEEDDDEEDEDDWDGFRFRTT